jgi:hypothetical protein
MGGAKICNDKQAGFTSSIIEPHKSEMPFFFVRPEFLTAMNIKIWSSEMKHHVVWWIRTNVSGLYPDDGGRLQQFTSQKNYCYHLYATTLKPYDPSLD